MERLTKGIIGLMEIYIRPNTKRCKTSANYFNSQGTRDQNDARELNYTDNRKKVYKYTAGRLEQRRNTWDTVPRHRWTGSN